MKETEIGKHLRGSAMKDEFHYIQQGCVGATIAEIFGVIEHVRQPSPARMPAPTFSPEVKAEFAKLAERWRSVGLGGGPCPTCGRRW